jgi:ABC-type antimicrobial peptide transport system permease subunit
MDSRKRFYGRVAVLSAVGGLIAVAVGIGGLVNGSTTAGVALLIGGLCALQGARTTWKLHRRVPSELPQTLTPDVRAQVLARVRRRVVRLLVVMWFVSVGIGYALLGVFGVIWMAVGVGITFFIAIRLSDRMNQRWFGVSASTQRPD